MAHATFAHFYNVFNISKFGANPISSSDFSPTTIVTDCLFPKGGFPPSRNFYKGTHVNFTKGHA